MVPIYEQMEIKIRETQKPKQPNLEDDLNWICKSFGFFEERDKQKTASRVFKIIIDATKTDDPVSSNEIAERIGVTRGAVINHLHRMLSSGLVVKRESGYLLRSDNMFDTIGEIEDDIERMMKRMKRICEEIDQEIGLSMRRLTEEE